MLYGAKVGASCYFFSQYSPFVVHPPPPATAPQRENGSKNALQALQLRNAESLHKSRLYMFIPLLRRNELTTSALDALTVTAVSSEASPTGIRMNDFHSAILPNPLTKCNRKGRNYGVMRICALTSENTGLLCRV
jgi:hypothetical protein